MTLSYLRYLLTVETSTIKAATEIATLTRKNFLPHRATISTEIGENFGSVIAYPPRKKLRPFPLARIGPLPLLAVPRGTVICRQFCRPPRVGGWRANRFAAQPRGHDNRPIPNISGTFTEHGNTSGMQCTGAFTGEERIGLKSNQGGAWDGGRVTLNSSRSSRVYGSSSSVQPPAIALLPCIKA